MIREKHRYLLVEYNNEMPQDKTAFSKALHREIMSCFGQLHYFKGSFRIMEFPSGNFFIIRSSLNEYENLIRAFALIKKLGGDDAAFYTLRSSGTIKALKQYLGKMQKDAEGAE